MDLNTITQCWQRLHDSVNEALQSGFTDEAVIADLKSDNEELRAALESYASMYPEKVDHITLMRDGCLRICTSYTRTGFDRQRQINHGASMIATGYSKWVSRDKFTIPPYPGDRE